MDTAIPLAGLQVNGQTFFARTRLLTLTATGCEGVLKLTWSFPYPTYRFHLSWLLWRLKRVAKQPAPWTWSSQRHDTKDPVRFRAWVVSPMGFCEAHPLVGAEFYLHFALAPDNAAADTAPVVCPERCTHA